MDLVARLVRILEVDRIDLEKREVALAFLRASDLAFDGVTGTQRKAPDLRWRNIDIVRACEIVGVGRSQEAEAVLEDLDNTFADDVSIASGELLQDSEHQLLLSERARILDLELFGKGE